MSRLELGEDPGGRRFFLEGEAVHCGELLEVEYRTGGASLWIPVRMEFKLWKDVPQAIICLDGLGGRFELWCDPEPRLGALSFRWPERRARRPL